jgi:hypothetical protein
MSWLWLAPVRRATGFGANLSRVSRAYFQSRQSNGPIQAVRRFVAIAISRDLPSNLSP